MSAPRMTIEQYREYCKRNVAFMERKAKDKASATPRPALRAVKTSKWSETEKRYYWSVLGGHGEYEGAELRITPADMEKHVYTPDFVTVLDNSAKVYHEVKGTYRLGSQDAARLRWCFAANAHPAGVFVWAKESKRRGYWDIEVWYDGGRTRLKERGVRGMTFNAKGGVLWVR